MKRDDSGQALTEYTFVMVALFFTMWGLAHGIDRFHSGGFLALLRGFGIYAKSFDLILSLPFP